MIELRLKTALAVAATVVAHVSVTLWRIDDVFEVSIPRSFSPAFCHWLQGAAEEFGFEVRA